MTRPDPRRAFASLVLVLCVLALLGACGGATPSPSPAATLTPSVPSPTAPAPTDPSPGTGAIADLCGLVGADIISQTLGEPFEGGATTTFAGTTRCTFTGASGDSVELAVTPGFSSLSGWEMQMQTLGVTAADAVEGVGESAYAQAGLPFGDPGAQFSAFDQGTGFDVTIRSDGDQALLVEAVTTLGRLLVESLT